MYCTNCGTQLSETFRYCPQCGAAAGTQPSRADGLPPANRAVRSRTDRKVAGVCAGLARYFGVDVTLVRILMVVFTIWPVGLGLLFYVVCWIVMPNEPLMLPSADNTNLVKAQ
jgi:phage shock protein C